MTNSWNGDTANHPTIHSNRFAPEPPKMKPITYVSVTKDLPAEEHYAVLVETSISYPDPYDDRHTGSTASTAYLEYIAFGDEKALESWVIEASKSHKSFKVLFTKPVKTEVKAVFSIVK